MTLRSMGTVVALLGAGCAPTYVIQPVAPVAGDKDMAVTATSGLTLYADAHAWNAEPRNLDDYLTPIWIEIVDQRIDDVRINYADFALVDSSGFRYAALNPYSEQPATAGVAEGSGAAPSPSALFEPLGEPPYRSAFMLIAHGGGGGGFHGGGGGGFHGGGFHGGFHGHEGFHGGGFHGHGEFHEHPHVGLFGFGYYPAWGDYYGPYWWGGYYYPPEPPHDLLRLGLSQGVVNAGGRVSGFIYFHNAASPAHQLQLTWTAHGTDGRVIGTLAVPFVVVKD